MRSGRYTVWYNKGGKGGNVTEMIPAATMPKVKKILAQAKREGGFGCRVWDEECQVWLLSCGRR